MLGQDEKVVRYGKETWPPNFTLTYDGVTFEVHKDIICVKCETIATTCKLDPTVNRVDIPSIHAATKEHMLRFLDLIYGDSKPISEKLFLGLVYIAHWTGHQTLLKTLKNYTYMYEQSYCESLLLSSALQDPSIVEEAKKKMLYVYRDDPERIIDQFATCEKDVILQMWKYFANK